MAQATTDMLKKHLPAAMLVLTGLAGNAYAAEDDPWYTVEVVVFENRAAGAGDTERWPDDPGTPDYAHAITLVPAAGDETTEQRASAVVSQPLPYETLGEDEMQLTTLVKRMESSQDYRPLLHIAWRQPATKSGDSPPVRISTLPPATADETAASAPVATSNDGPSEAATTETATVEGVQADTSEAAANRPEVTLEGTIDLSRNRYLHLDVDLLYRPPAATQTAGLFSIFEADQPRITAYRMHQHRRVRSNQLDYFDHPRFGLMTVVTPVDLATPEPTDDADGETPE